MKDPIIARAEAYAKSFDLLCDRKWREYHEKDDQRDYPCKHGHIGCSTERGGTCCDEQYAYLTSNYGPDPYGEKQEMYTAIKLTKNQGFDWVVRKDGEGILVGFDGQPERYDSESRAKHEAMLLNAKEGASELEKLVIKRLEAVSPTPFGFLVLLRMAQAAIRAVNDYKENKK